MSFLCAKKRRFQIRPQAENAKIASSNALGIPSSLSIRYRVRPVLKDHLKRSLHCLLSPAQLSTDKSLPRRYFIILSNKTLLIELKRTKKGIRFFLFFAIISEKTSHQISNFLEDKKFKNLTSNKAHLKSRD